MDTFKLFKAIKLTSESQHFFLGFKLKEHVKANKISDKQRLDILHHKRTLYFSDRNNEKKTDKCENG